MASARSPRGDGKGRLLRFGAILLSTAMLLSACAESQFTYVQSADRTAFFRVPRDWETFDRREILVHAGLSLSQSTNEAHPWLVAVDAAPRPSVDHVLRLNDAPRYPVIDARTITLPATLHDQISLSGMRNFVYPVDRLVQEGSAEVRSYSVVSFPGGFHGNRIEFDIILGGQYQVDADNEVMRVNQLTVLDPTASTMYLFMLRCESHCYRDHQSLIEQITQSWTVKGRSR
jgi:hypothetical protein